LKLGVFLCNIYVMDAWVPPSLMRPSSFKPPIQIINLSFIDLRECVSASVRVAWTHYGQIFTVLGGRFGGFCYNSERLIT
jgi:hypothetical protein